MAAKRVTSQVYDAELQARAVTLAKSGGTVRGIAAELGVGRTTVQRLLERATQRIVEEPVRDWLRESLAHLEQMMLGLATQGGAYTGDAKAVSAGVKVLERIARLKGLDAPTKVQADVRRLEDMPTEELLARLAELGKGSGGT